MNEKIGFYSQAEKEKMQKAMLKKLTDIFKELDKDKCEIAKDLIEQVSFMACELKDLKQIILRDGSIEEYQNGRFQKGIKKSASVEVYNSILKNYTTCLKQLFDLIKADGGDVDDGFDDFINAK